MTTIKKGNPEKRIVSFQADPELRAAETRDRISGYAVVWGAESVDLGWFTESIQQGAFKRSLDANPDVKGLVNHNPDLILARTRAGNLKLVEDARGLRIEMAPLPNTQMARDYAENIAVGLIDQMSFAFNVVSERWSLKDGKEYREILEAELVDVSVVTYPAYPATQAEARDGMQEFRSVEQAFKERPVPAAVRTAAGYWRYKQSAIDRESQF